MNSKKTSLGIEFEVETFPNHDIIEIHVNFKVTEKRYFEAHDWENSDDRVKELGNALTKIRGIYDVGFDEFTVCLEKGRMFDWDNITSMALLAIDQYRNDLQQ